MLLGLFARSCERQSFKLWIIDYLDSNFFPAFADIDRVFSFSKAKRYIKRL